MLILSDCLTDIPDEGCLKVANSLVKRIKKKYPDTTVISYGPRNSKADVHLKLNKLLMNWSLISLIRGKHESVLYIPFSSNTMGSVLRTWILSKMTRDTLKVLFVLQHPMNRLAKMLIRNSGAEIIVLSQKAYSSYQSLVGDKAIYIKTGVDTAKFKPVDKVQKKILQKKYGVIPGRHVVLHVGHLKEGRNIRHLLKLGEAYQVFLVISSETKSTQDITLRKELERRSNITIIESYLPNIEEVYQMADVYFFPVMEEENCIDIPLSVLEAAACGIPVVTTPFGELKELIHQEGFYEIRSFETNELEDLIRTAISDEQDIRTGVLGYDWNVGIGKLTNDL